MINIIDITFSDNYYQFFLTVTSFTSIYFGVNVIISKNPIFSVLFLIGLFFIISVHLICTGLHFIGLSYLLVYIGAISILFLFILMLINIRTSELLTDNYNSIPLAIITILLFNNSLRDVITINKLTDIVDYLERPWYLFTSILDTMYINTSNNILFESYSNNYIASVTGKAWDTILVQLTHISSVGNILYTNQYILYILASLILLLSMVGCIKITMNDDTTKIRTSSNQSNKILFSINA